MAGKWDSNLKRLVAANPQEFVDWLLKGAVVTRELTVEFNREIFIDILYEVILRGKTVLVHIEFQRYEDEDMAWRVLEYNVFATNKYKCPVYSFVIYLKKEGKIAESPLVIPPDENYHIWHFNFTNIKLWEIPTEQFRQIQSVGVLPLLPLTREGGHPAVVNDVLAGIEQAPISREEQENLWTITFHLSILGLRRPEDKAWLRKRFYMYRDIIHDTEIYQIILQEGREKGREEGREKGLEEQRQQEIEDICRIIFFTVQNRFPELHAEARERVRGVTDLSVLNRLALDMIAATSAEQVHARLASLKKAEEH